MFRYWVETERRSYLANHVEVQTRAEGGRTWVELELRDAWVLDMFRTNRFLPRTKVLSFKDVVVEELPRDEVDEAQGTLDLDRIVPSDDGPPATPEEGEAP